MPDDDQGGNAKAESVHPKFPVKTPALAQSLNPPKTTPKFSINESVPITYPEFAPSPTSRPLPILSFRKFLVALYLSSGSAVILLLMIKVLLAVQTFLLSS